MPPVTGPNGRLLLFTGFSGFTQRLDNTAALLQADLGIAIDCLVFGRDNAAYLRNHAKAQYGEIACVEDLLDACASAPPPDGARVQEIEAALGQSLTHIAYSERTFIQHTHDLPLLRSLSQDEIAAHVTCLHDALARMVDRADWVLAYTCASIESELLYYLARAREKTFLTLNEQRIGYRWSIARNNMDRHEDVLARYHDPGFAPTEAGAARFEAYRAKVSANRKNTVEAAYQQSVAMRKRLSPANLLRYLRNFLGGAHTQQYYLAPDRWQHTANLLRFKLRERYVRKHLQTALPKRPFVYLPLSLIPEASTLIRGLHHYDQLSLIKRLSLELPIDWVLLVREHPSAIGITPIAFYEELRRIFNVRLMSPHESATDCIRQSEAVVTVTGTTAFESLALGRRTIVLGAAIYDTMQSVFKVGDLSEIGPLLRQPWTEADATAQIDDMIRFASALEAAPGFDDPDNILWTAAAANPAENPVDANIAAALRAHLQTNKSPAAP